MQARCALLHEHLSAGGWLDNDTWTRARAWALALGLAYLAHADGNDDLEALAATTINEALLA